jgi:transcription antitermination factor NusG
MVSITTSQEWYVWTVKSGKFDVVKKYIEERLPEVKKILYPTITTERITKKGEVKKKKIPLYAGYIFLQYKHRADNPRTWISLNNHPFVTHYVGPCTAQDLVSVDSLQKVEKLNLEAVKNFKLNDKVRVNGGVFEGFRGLVVGKSSNSIRVEVNNSITVVFSPDDLDILAREG